ncbi:hypothetical protein DVH24_037736 [Malus domestica]|uniref:Uncharacterized protein n=1 Tax=Malus domestica TaxID=3750 RepID=A0A498JYX6_MALDO|nr:hypothetical protein DVH24_037736 [Malus domestica]
MSYPGPDPTTSQARLCRSMILSVLGPDYAIKVLFLGTHTKTSQWVTHHGIALARTRLTSEFLRNLKPVSSLPKGLVLGRDENIHIRLTRSTLPGDVGCYRTSDKIGTI